MKLVALQTGSVTNTEGSVLRFWKGQTIDVKKSDYDIDFDKHPGFERASDQAKAEKK